ncbi:MAG: recombinase family protein [Thiothrix sp.]|uniref:recombinase family protein n=1 Tax=Thiothrix sp. TaxID=1032 RepID=UPI00262537F0|nr:recombinase family protein [Thiothrix sp.]MDD5394871.1 recombinase family protein [Thiothrix sp.]
MLIGYARDNSGQGLEVQIGKLRQYGCERLFQEKESAGGRAGHTELTEALGYAQQGDVLVVTHLSQLAHSLHGLGQVSQQLSQQQVRLVVLDQGLDSSSQAGMYQTMLAVAEFDRSLINGRIAEGVAKAKAAGVKFGRKDKLAAAELELLRQEFNTPGVNKAALAKKYGIHRSSLYRLVQEGQLGWAGIAEPSKLY